MTAPIVFPDAERRLIPAYRLGSPEWAEKYVNYADVIARFPRVPGQLWERLRDYHDYGVKSVVNHPAYTYRLAIAYSDAIGRSAARRRHPAGKALRTAS